MLSKGLQERIALHQPEIVLLEPDEIVQWINQVGFGIKAHTGDHSHLYEIRHPATGCTRTVPCSVLETGVLWTVELETDRVVFQPELGIATGSGAKWLQGMDPLLDRLHFQVTQRFREVHVPVEPDHIVGIPLYQLVACEASRELEALTLHLFESELLQLEGLISNTRSSLA